MRYEEGLGATPPLLPTCVTLQSPGEVGGHWEQPQRPALSVDPEKCPIVHLLDVVRGQRAKLADTNPSFGQKADDEPVPLGLGHIVEAADLVRSKGGDGRPRNRRKMWPRPVGPYVTQSNPVEKLSDTPHVRVHAAGREGALRDEKHGGEAVENALVDIPNVADSVVVEPGQEGLSKGAPVDVLRCGTRKTSRPARQQIVRNHQFERLWLFRRRRGTVHSASPVEADPAARQ